MLERTRKDDRATKGTSVPRTKGRSARAKNYQNGKKTVPEKETKTGKEENSAIRRNRARETRK